MARARTVADVLELVLGVDLRTAAVKCTPGDSKAAAVLIEEVEKRTQIRWPLNAGGSPAIALERGSGPAEGYRIRVANGGVTVTGSDARGVLFGVGRLLRSLRA